jgi:hypothetical protein
MGAANGMTADGKILTNAEAKEVWVGITEGYAGLLMSEGMQDEAWKSALGLYHVIYESKGYWFRTPEAWDVTGNFRAGNVHAPDGHLGAGDDPAMSEMTPCSCWMGGRERGYRLETICGSQAWLYRAEQFWWVWEACWFQRQAREQPSGRPPSRDSR